MVKFGQLVHTNISSNDYIILTLKTIQQLFRCSFLCAVHVWILEACQGVLDISENDHKALKKVKQIQTVPLCFPTILQYQTKSKPHTSQNTNIH